MLAELSMLQESIIIRKSPFVYHVDIIPEIINNKVMERQLAGCRIFMQKFMQFSKSHVLANTIY